MKILIIGQEPNYQESLLKFGGTHHYTFEKEHRTATAHLAEHDVIFDFILAGNPIFFEHYTDIPAAVFINTVTNSLSELASGKKFPGKGRMFGFNGMHTFVNRTLLEVSLWNADDEPSLKTVCDQLQTDFLVVDDRVGLVTPRIICMIINEAYYTTMEGTATREDIDLAMKLGTNYPYGPFEWCQRIGIQPVYELLEAVYADTKDERYKICPLLRKEYLRSK